MQRNEIRKIMQKYVWRMVIIVIGTFLILNASNMLMTWISTDILHIANTYISSEVQFLGTMLIALIILFIIFFTSYRSRKRHLIALTESIEKVAKGDFSTRIKYNKHDYMGHVYHDFNRMITELEQVQVLRTDFINSFSHEFKTPIASINGFSSLMLEKEMSKEEQITYLKIIKEESERLSKMTSNAILLTKLSSREFSSKMETYDIGEQLRQCSILLSPQWMEKKQVFSGEFPEISFTGSKELLQHLFINLIGNAIKYTPSGGEITVNLSEEAEQIVIAVTDSGIGMDEATVEHIYDAYFQGDAAHANPGLGLGLAIAKQIITIHEGHIKVESKPGEGSTFTVYLPKKTEDRKGIARVLSEKKTV